jgi:hypothetical protein
LDFGAKNGQKIGQTNEGAFFFLVVISILIKSSLGQMFGAGSGAFKKSISKLHFSRSVCLRHRQHWDKLSIFFKLIENLKWAKKENQHKNAHDGYMFYSPFCAAFGHE